MSLTLPTYADIEAAAARLDGRAVKTPLIESPVLNQRMGGRVFLKLENLQRVGAFKFRGAFNRLSLIPESERAKGVVAFSSGNHAQGVAAAAGMLGIRAAIVMPSDAPHAKIEGTRALGAEVIFCARNDDRAAIGQTIASERGAALIRPFDDAAIIAGQGTVGLELARQAAELGAELDDVFVPCGGGGLVSGVALALSHLSPGTRVTSVEPENYDGMRRSLSAGVRSRAPGGSPSLADALLTLMPGEIPFALAASRLEPGLTINDGELSRAVSYAAQRLKLIIEPGGAAGLAALLAGKITARNKAIALIISGGNCDFATVATACDRVPEP